MSNEPRSPQTPTRDEKDNEDFGTTEQVGQGGYPEEGPAGTEPAGTPDEGRPEQPQRREG